MAWIPVPFQMLLAAGGAIACRANLPLAVALCWVANPVTMPPMFYGAYKLGCLLLGNPSQDIDIEFSWHWLSSVFETVAPPLLLGALLLACISALCGYLATLLLWRLSVVRRWRQRRGAQA